jgi:cell wall-associated NlpC family hydrolase
MTDWVERQLINSVKLRDRNETANCWQFVATVLHDEYGIEVPSFRAGEEMRNFEAIRLAKQWEGITKEEARAGDVVIVNRGPGIVPHVGIITPDGRVMHYAMGQALVEHLGSISWKRKPCEFYRRIKD